MKKQNVRRIWAIALAGACMFGMMGCDVKGGDSTSSDKNTIIIGGDSTSGGPITELEKYDSPIKNVILLIGDGMGPNQVKAGEIYNQGKLEMQQLPYSVKVETRSADSTITDSAAAATALATGVRTGNGRVGMTTKLETLETIVDIAARGGKRTAVVTTEELYGATPMAFSSHSAARGASRELLLGAASTQNPSNVNLFLSYPHKYDNILEVGGYECVQNPADISELTGDKYYGAYNIVASAPSMSVNPNAVSLDGLLMETIEYLSQDEDGFFLMAEGAHIDHGGHNNDFTYMLSELMAFDMAVGAVMEWAKDREDTVVIVTADHETGGLQLSEEMTKENMFTASGFANGGYYQWTTEGHSATDVWCFMYGMEVDFSQYTFGSNERIANTDIFKIMKWLITGKK